ncbi:PPR1A phosphatase, partial [Halcyon senegalensis]|nr:PPR1A phosphatase [Halcyon senegalensis]
MSPRQRKKVSRTTPTMKELQLMVEHHLCKQAQGEEEEEVAPAGQERGPGHCHCGDPQRGHSPGGSCPLATHEGGPGPGPRTPGDGRRSLAEEGTHIAPKDVTGQGAAGSQ